MTLLFLESLGTSELLVILVVALIIFGPRKLPELGRSLGKGLGEFKRASDEFKSTWEREVNLDSDRERKVGEAMLPPESRREALPVAATAENTIASPGVPSGIATPVGAEASESAQTIARGAGASAGDSATHVATFDPNVATFDPNAPAAGTTPTDVSAGHEAGEAAPPSTHKTEWL